MKFLKITVSPVTGYKDILFYNEVVKIDEVVKSIHFDNYSIDYQSYSNSFIIRIKNATIADLTRILLCVSLPNCTIKGEEVIL